MSTHYCAILSFVRTWGSVYREFPIVFDNMDLRIMQLPEPGSRNTSWDALGRVLAVHPQEFLNSGTLPLPEVFACLPLGLDYNEDPPQINIAFPSTSHIPAGTPVVFDVFLSTWRVCGDMATMGHTVQPVSPGSMWPRAGVIPRSLKA